MLFCDVSQGKSRNRLHMITLSFRLFGMKNSKGAFVPTGFFQKLYFFFNWSVILFTFLTPPLSSQELTTFPGSFIYDLAGRQAWSVISQAVFIRRLSEQAFSVSRWALILPMLPFQWYLTVHQENATARIGRKWNL